MNIYDRRIIMPIEKELETQFSIISESFDKIIRQNFCVYGRINDRNLIDDTLKSIAYYIELVLSDEQAKSIYIELLQYMDIWHKSSQYKNNCKEAIQCINVIGKQFCDDPDFEKMCSAIDGKCGKWIDMSRFRDLDNLSCTKETLEHMRDLQFIDCYDYKILNIFLKIICGDSQGLNGIYPYWIQCNGNRLEFSLYIQKIKHIAEQFKSKEVDNYEIKGSKAARELYYCYIANIADPKYKEMDTRALAMGVSVYHNNIALFNAKEYWEKILKNCKRLHGIIINKLKDKETKREKHRKISHWIVDIIVMGIIIKIIGNIIWEYIKKF